MNNFYDVNQNQLTRALKNKFSPSSVFFFNWYVSLYIKQPRNFLFLFRSHVLYSTLIDWLMFTGEEFDWFAWISHSTLRNIRSQCHGVYIFFKKSWITLDHLFYFFHHNCMSLSFYWTITFVAKYMLFLQCPDTLLVTWFFYYPRSISLCSGVCCILFVEIIKARLSVIITYQIYYCYY